MMQAIGINKYVQMKSEREGDLQGDKTEGGGNGHDLSSVQDPM
jgi:hypothetical protein